MRRFGILKLGLFLLFFGQGAWAQPPLAGADWITVPYNEGPGGRSCPVFFRDFGTGGRKVKGAVLYISALGLYEARLNGRRIGQDYFTPGFTVYDKRLQYQRYDVGDLLRSGSSLNSLRVLVGEGWYRGKFRNIKGEYRNNLYGDRTGLIVRLEIAYSDGSLETIVTDGSWRCSTSGIVSDIYDGELLDANFVAGQSFPVVLLSHSKDMLVPTEAEPVRKRETFRPVRVWTNGFGEQLADFGQNLAGWVKVRVKGKKGDTLKIFHAELLDGDGRFYTGNLREAQAVDRYVLDGKFRVYEPHFTYHGFRYVKVEGMDIRELEMEAAALYSDMRETGSFECSDAMVNQLHSNIVWGLKGNFLEIPTDCPQRSERLGWTGDAQVFVRTAGLLMDTRKLYAKWLRDVSAEQGPNGSVPNYVPRLSPGEPNVRSSMGWGDAVVMMPWELFRMYGDTAILREQYPAMRQWLGYLEGVSKNDLLDIRGYGDWYAMGDSTSLPYINQCFYVHSTRLVGKIAGLLGKKDEVAYYGGLAARLQAAFDKSYAALDTRATSTQTALLLALAFDLLPVEKRQSVADRLVGLIEGNGNRLATGFLGTPHLLPVLSRFGRSDVAYRLLLQRECPSWLYPVSKGATTMWERWDAVRPDGSIQQTSFNHYAYGAVGQWFYESVLGIRPLVPGYGEFEVRPELGGGLDWARGSYDSVSGKIGVDWRIDGKGMFRLLVEVPQGCRAVVWLPDGSSRMVLGGKHVFSCGLKR